MRVTILCRGEPLWPKEPETPQCSAPVEDPPGAAWPEWRKRRYEGRPDVDYTRCLRRSLVDLDGKPYCRQHGAYLVLDHMLLQQASTVDLRPLLVPIETTTP